jgi:hypothetical protein
MDTRLRGYDKKAACNLIATAVSGCKKQHFPNMTARLVSISYKGKPVRPQARLLRLPGSIVSRTCLLMISMSTITRAMPSAIW